LWVGKANVFGTVVGGRPRGAWVYIWSWSDLLLDCTLWRNFWSMVVTASLLSSSPCASSPKFLVSSLIDARIGSVGSNTVPLGDRGVALAWSSPISAVYSLFSISSSDPGVVVITGPLSPVAKE
jgi:hypothetical protein